MRRGRIALTAVLAIVVALVVGALIWTPTLLSPRPVAPPEVVLGPALDSEVIGGWQVDAPPPTSVSGGPTGSSSGSVSWEIRDPSADVGAAVTRPRFPVVAQREYAVQAFARVTEGSQRLTLSFYDAAGLRLHHVKADASSGVQWTRVSLGAIAPDGAVAADYGVSSDAEGVSRGTWDSLSHLEAWVPNGEFNRGQGSTIAGWDARVTGAGTVTVVTDTSRPDTTAVLLQNPGPAATATLQSVPVPVFPSVGTDIAFWIKPQAGRGSLTVAWLDARGQQVGSQPVALTGLRSGEWQRVGRSVVAPPDAQSLQMTFATSDADAARIALDSVEAAPSSSGSAQSLEVSSLGEPLDAFSNSKASDMLTVDGRAKLATIVSGYPARFQVVDVETGAVEVDLPFDNRNNSQSGALVTGANGEVYAGTQGGYLFRWRPGATRLEPLGRVTPTATAVYDLEVGPDGVIWGGTYPGGEVFSYVSGASTTVNHGQVAPGRSYVRALAVTRDHVYAAVSSDRPTIIRFDVADPSRKLEIPPPVQLASGIITELRVNGRFLATNLPTGTTITGEPHVGQRYLLDLEASSWDAPANIPGQAPTGMDSRGRFFYLTGKRLVAVDQTGTARPLVRTDMPPGRTRLIHRGKLAGVEGEWFIAHSPESGLTALNLETFEERTYSFTFQPVSLRVKSLAAGPNGTVFAGGYGGASLAVVDPATGDVQYYPEDRTARGVIGEIEGMATQGQYQFLGTYTRAKIFRYDTARPWVDGSNPAQLLDLSSRAQDRPQAWATSGGSTYFGTVPGSGTLGGVLGIIGHPTAAPRVVDTPVPDHSIVSMAASGTIVFGGTSRWGGFGATPKASGAQVFAYDTATDTVLWAHASDPGLQSIGGMVLLPDGSLWAASGGTLYQLDRATGAVLRRVPVERVSQPETPTYRNIGLVQARGLLYLAVVDRIYTIDPVTLRISLPVASGVTHRNLAVIGDDVYYPSGVELMRVRPR